MRSLLVVVPLVLCATPAMAIDTWMWGIGPHVGTMVLPGRYPVSLPKLKGGDSESGPRLDEGIVKAQHDLILGVEGVYYMNRHHRVGFTAGGDVGLGLGEGRRFSDWSFILTYDYAIQGRALDVLFGGGVGAGTQGWRGPEEQTLRVNTFPLRGEASVLARDNTRAYQLTLFMQLNVPSNSVYTDAAGDQPDINGGFYLTSGVELSVLFGDFEPPSSSPSPVKRTPPPVDDAAN
ncbi:MAG: hypothetical protein AB8H79_18720 [Myxococcota bacterium]